MDSSTRYQLVSSLYGPGTVGCWQLSVCSVVISWTLNRTYRRKDSIDNDFLAALAFPAIAAGHLIYQVIHFPGSRTEIVTTQDENLIPYAAAIEASLNICETFSSIALSLFPIAAYHHNLKRAALVLLIGIFCFGAEVMLFLQDPKADISLSSFTRPFLLNAAGIMIAILITLGAIALVFTIFSLYYSYFRQGSKKREADSTRERIANLNQQIDSAHARGDTLAVERLRTALLEEVAVQELKENLGMRLIANVTFLFLPLSLITTLGLPFGAWGVTKLGELHAFTWRLLFFIPEAGVSVRELDQAAALAGGATTLAFSLFHAFKSRFRASRGAEHT